MTQVTSTARRLMLGALFGAAAAVAFSAPAYADDEAQRPGGVLGTVVEVVDEVTTEPEPTTEPDPPAEPEPEQEQAPEPVHSEEPASDEPAADEPVIDLPPVEVPVDVPPVVVDPPPVVVVVPPVVVAPTPTAPILTPTAAPLPTTPEQAPTQPTGETLSTDTSEEPAPPVETVAPAPTDLPVPIGPVLGRALDDGIHVTEPATATPDDVRECDGKTLTLDDIRRDIRTTGDTTTAPATDRADSPDRRPCPNGPAGPVVQAGGLSAVTGSTTQHGDQAGGDTTTWLAWPALHRIQQLRARGDLPAGRSPHVEPGPA
ncbi:hypothetical protein [Micromonospora taraxaci]|uniref:hypothetical protein n=1 Tax=Micromonospora taraxaci TaxID=1316803 RepID=UPI0033A7D44D